MAMRQLLVATTNRGKVREIRPLLAGLPFDLVTLTDFPPIAAPEETGSTFAENARLKALYYAAATGALTVAEDSGLEIKALDGAPGVESARLGGPGAPNTARFAMIYGALRAKHATGSPARFVCALALADEGTIVFEARGTMEGTIAPEPKGGAGFGYDPIFFYPPFGCTLAEAGAAKSTVSHRGQAFRALHGYLTANSSIGSS
jgi:XTP/dITP diphosphohydrolase